jgi:hypothetical protein
LDGNGSFTECNEYRETLNQIYTCEGYFLAHRLQGEIPIWNYTTYYNWLINLKKWTNPWAEFKRIHFVNKNRQWKNWRLAWLDAKALLKYKYQNYSSTRVKRQIFPMATPLELILGLIKSHHGQSSTIGQYDINDHICHL